MIKKLLLSCWFVDRIDNMPRWRRTQWRNGKSSSTISIVPVALQKGRRWRRQSRARKVAWLAGDKFGFVHAHWYPHTHTNTSYTTHSNALLRQCSNKNLRLCSVASLTNFRLQVSALPMLSWESWCGFWIEWIVGLLCHMPKWFAIPGASVH